MTVTLIFLSVPFQNGSGGTVPIAESRLGVTNLDALWRLPWFERPLVAEARREARRGPIILGFSECKLLVTFSDTDGMEASLARLAAQAILTLQAWSQMQQLEREQGTHTQKYLVALCKSKGSASPSGL